MQRSILGEVKTNNNRKPLVTAIEAFLPGAGWVRMVEQRKEEAPIFNR